MSTLFNSQSYCKSLSLLSLRMKTDLYIRNGMQSLFYTKSVTNMMGQLFNLM